MEKITVTDLRDLGHCTLGIKRWCAAVGVDFRTLLKEGIPVEEWEQIEDGMAVSALKRLRERNK